MKNLKDYQKCIINFRDDDEFLNFCLEKVPTRLYDEETGYDYYDYDYTDLYKDALNNDHQFKILDKDSKINKRGAVTRGLISKEVKNLISKW